jgi:Cytochrome c oxidase subunit IV
MPLPYRQVKMKNPEIQDTQAKNTETVKISWHEPLPEKIPEATYWPFLLAFGIVLVFWGLVLTWLISLAGVIIFVASLAGWIGEMIHEHD